MREDKTVGRSFAERELMRRTGNAPHSTFDEVADGVGAIEKSVKASTAASKEIGQPAPLGKAIKRLTKPAGPAKKSKYGNQKCESGGVKFDSKREMMRWHDLVIMQTRGEISELDLQVPFVLAPAVVIDGRKRPALRYVADFVYVKAGEDSQTVEDVKGRITEGYRIKRHLMAARGITIKEIK
ncbi:MAG TPA: DUF1064 domain-containing protein [Sphingomicrobium sp.]|nr:DUF1064 domain-containing protein [Sphingomicrobium sp.]